VGRDAGSFNTVSARCEIIFNEMHLGLNDGEFVTEVAESVILMAVSLDFGGGVSVIEVGNGMSKCVVGRSGAIEECIEPGGNWLGDVLR
jgi:hypothetical protein